MSGSRPERTVGALVAWIAVGATVVEALASLFGSAEAGIVPVPLPVLAVMAVSGVAWFVWDKRRRSILATVTHIRFAMAVLIALLVATVLGTAILQTTNPAIFGARYGAAAPVMTWLGLDDVFGSAWFRWLLTLFAVTLVVSIVRRRAWRRRQLPFLFAHGGVVLLFVGGTYGAILGSRGMMHFQEGDRATTYRTAEGVERPLGFELALLDFAVDRREPELRLYLLERGARGFETTASLPVDAPRTISIDGVGAIEIRPAPPGHAADAVQLQIPAHGDQGASEIVVRASGGNASATAFDGGARVLRLARRRDDVVNFASTVEITADGHETRREIRVNEPTSVGDVTLYQASYDPANPRYSGILVVRDPGLPLVYAGLLATLFGVLWLMLGRAGIALPRRASRAEDQREAAAAGAATTTRAPIGRAARDGLLAELEWLGIVDEKREST